MSAAVAALELPAAVFKTCPWEPRELVATGLRQWLRCCAPALWDNQVIGMPSRDGGAPASVTVDPIDDQLGRTVVAWTLVAQPGEECVLWDLDARLGLDEPWGVDSARVAAIQSRVASC